MYQCLLRLFIAVHAVWLGVQAIEPCGWLGTSQYACKEVDRNYWIYWKVVGGNLTVGLEVLHTAGAPVSWIGFGMSEAGGMYGADVLAVLYNSVTNSWEAQDYFSTGTRQPELDVIQDVTLISIDNSTEALRAVVTRPLDSCDEQDIPVELDMQHNVIWAYGTTDFGYHDTARGTTIIQFSRGVRKLMELESRDDDSSLSVATLSMPDTAVPLQDDYYVCLDLQLPMDKQRHIIEYEAALEGAPNHVHHMVVYACGRQPSTYGQGVYKCLGMPAECLQYTLVWTPGMKVMQLPEAAGLLIGPGGIQFVALQLHYNNVPRDEGMVDHSGFKIKMTDKLRPNNVGVLTLGHVGFAIPPRQASWSISPSVCPGQCTARLPQPVTIINSMLHMHKSGLRMVLRHIRNGTELRPLAMRRHYDFNFQPAADAPVGNNVLMPGDTLLTQCTYSTRDRNSVTRFGEGTNDEMCFSWIMYYPKFDPLDACLTMSTSESSATCSTWDKIMSSLAVAAELGPSSLIKVIPGMIQSGELITGLKKMNLTEEYGMFGSKCRMRTVTAQRRRNRHHRRLAQ